MAMVAEGGRQEGAREARARGVESQVAMMGVGTEAGTKVWERAAADCVVVGLVVARVAAIAVVKLVMAKGVAM